MQLWAKGAKARRSALTQDELVDRMRGGKTRPQGEVGFASVRILSEPSAAALADIRLDLESTHGVMVETTERRFLWKREEGV